MAWLRYSDDYNRKPEIHALDDGSYRALQCLIEAAENYDACGMAIDSYAASFYPHARQKLRNEIRKLADRGLVHLISGPKDRDHDCPTCQIRWEELRGEGAEELRKKLGTSSTTSTQSSNTKPMWFCVRDFYPPAMTPTQKRQTKQGNAKRQQKKRNKDKAAASRRDALTPSHLPVPVPDHKLRIIDHVPLSEETEPPSTASPSEPSSGTADRDAVSWLREDLDKRRAACGVSCKWKPEHQEHLDAVVLRASRTPGDTFKILTEALDGFFVDPTQLKYRYSPAGLAHGFDKYAAPILEQEAEAFKKEKRAKIDAKLEAIDAAILAKDAEKKAERKANGTPDERGAEPVAIAELVPPIGAKLGRT